MEGARPAVDGDADRLAELEQAARAELATERGAGIFLRREGGGGRRDGTGRVWAGTFDGVVVGYLHAAVEPLAGGGRLGLVDELYVEPEARAVGVGEAMIEQALAWLAEEGCEGVDAYALPGMRDTKNFFETFGFTARLLVVHHSFDRTRRPQPAPPGS